jgi:hypothetical protein
MYGKRQLRERGEGEEEKKKKREEGEEMGRCEVKKFKWWRLQVFALSGEPEYENLPRFFGLLSLYILYISTLRFLFLFNITWLYTYSLLISLEYHLLDLHLVE